MLPGEVSLDVRRELGVVDIERHVARTDEHVSHEHRVAVYVGAAEVQQPGDIIER